MIHSDKYCLRQYLVKEPDLELRRILQVVRHHNRSSRNSEFMDQKSIVLSLNRKSWTARVIQDDRIATLGEVAIAYRTMMKYLREAQIIPRKTARLSDSFHLTSTIQTKLF
jgi:hypothetical protein